MSEVKCDICGKTFLGHDNDNNEGEELIICEECQKTTLYELSNGKGDDDEQLTAR